MSPVPLQDAGAQPAEGPTGPGAAKRFLTAGRPLNSKESARELDGAVDQAQAQAEARPPTTIELLARITQLEAELEYVVQELSGKDKALEAKDTELEGLKDLLAQDKARREAAEEEVIVVKDELEELKRREFERQFDPAGSGGLPLLQFKSSSEELEHPPSAAAGAMAALTADELQAQLQRERRAAANLKDELLAAEQEAFDLQDKVDEAKEEAARAEAVHDRTIMGLTGKLLGLDYADEAGMP
ncbi:hypothetical protein C2E21_4603 [Chlorella sorokiniana]|uniref:Uncharacterized protein n=1 Tax=Chlorella sorokiniana TaxID=3076 RepID=A0A2P6TRY8_CHLSO|nr:hypothetical protein C2E21_4603 [Chlorella sorokiniana]|eukprot:PRW56825.1 hypothetical protein C2E21_4603 [Chlorella sorokiniana]